MAKARRAWVLVAEAVGACMVGGAFCGGALYAISHSVVGLVLGAIFGAGFGLMVAMTDES